jgi:hypothetical protein
MNKVDFLPKETGSLAHGVAPAPPGTLFVMGLNGGIRVAPDAGFVVVFGRREPDVHVCVGASDTHVSRRQGHISREDGRWLLHNTGRVPIRFPDSRLVLGGHHAELPTAYTPLFVVSPKQEHLLEVRIAGAAAVSARTERYETETSDAGTWELSPVERLVLVCLSQRYLRQDPHPQPLTWAQLADDLGRLRPGERWTAKRAAHIVTEVRKRLSSKVYGLVEDEVPPPIGNALNHNLISELLVTATLTESDLALL